MSWASSEVVSVLTFLLPGFVAAAVFYSLTSHPKPRRASTCEAPVQASRRCLSVQRLGDALGECARAVVEQVVVEVVAHGHEHPSVESPRAAARLKPFGGIVSSGVVVAGDEQSVESRRRNKCGERGGAECGGDGEVRARGAKRESGLNPFDDGEGVASANV